MTALRYFDQNWGAGISREQEGQMRDLNWVSVVAIAAGVAMLLLLLGPTLWTRWIGELPGGPS